MGRKPGLVETIRNRSVKAGLAGVADLGERLFDEAMLICDSEHEAAAMATASLISWLERGRAPEPGTST
jgi:hypothetical protein